MVVENPNEHTSSSSSVHNDTSTHSMSNDSYNSVNNYSGIESTGKLGCIGDIGGIGDNSDRSKVKVLDQSQPIRIAFRRHYLEAYHSRY